MRRTPVRSSTIASVGYAARSGTLEIEFTTGRVYRYRGVPPEIHQDLLAAGSKGRYFNHFIRDCYPCAEVRSR